MILKKFASEFAIHLTKLFRESIKQGKIPHGDIQIFKKVTVINGRMGIEKLQNDLDGVREWCRTWGKRLNLEKCKVMHFGKSNPKANYYMTDNSENELDIEETRLERGLGVNVDYDLKWSGHMDSIVGKANRMLDMLKRTFESRNRGLWKDLYVFLVKKHFEYAVQVWNPHLQGYIDKH